MSEHGNKQRGVNHRDDAGQTLLFRVEAADQAAALIRAGAHVEIQDYLGYTPLNYHLANTHVDVAIELIKHGADPNATDARGLTPLMHAREVNCTGALIRAGANIHAKATNGMTALMFAARLGNLSIAKILVEAGAGPDEVDASQETALGHANSGKSGYQELTEQFGPDNPALRMIFPESRYDEIIDLLEYSRKSAKSAFAGHPVAGRPALSFARSEAEVKVLVEFGNDVNEKDDLGLTPLMCASQAARVDVVRALVQTGARLDERDRYGNTALMRASGEKVLQVLTGANANVGLRYSGDITALMRSARMGHVDTVRMLIDAGASVNATDSEGKTARDHARLCMTRRAQYGQARQDKYPGGVELIEKLLPSSNLQQVIDVLKGAGGVEKYH